MIDDTLSRTVIGCAMDVHRELGPGYLEKVYENALSIALSDTGIDVAQQVSIPAQFRGRVVGDFVADLLVEGRLIVELKAVSNLLPVHETQLVSKTPEQGGAKAQKTNPVDPANPGILSKNGAWQ